MTKKFKVGISSDDSISGSILASTQSSGDEGGQIDLSIAQTNTTLNSGVAIDIYQDRLRIFETGGSNRGAYIDLSAAGTGVSSNLLAGGGSTSDSFKTISVAGQSNVVADSSTDTLNLIAGTNISIQTNATNDSITFNSSGSLISVDSITYPDYITFDTTPETIPTAQGSIYWDSGDGLPKTILNANVELGIGQEQVALVKNATGSSISKGKVVYIDGAQGQRPTIALSDADAESTSSKTLGLTAETIADGAEGFVTTFGVLRGVNTDGLTEGAALWLSSTAGVYTTTIPTDPAHLVFIGYVVKAHSSSGEIFVNPQNGYEINELHNVLITSASAGQVLQYDPINELWKNKFINNLIIDAYNSSGATIDKFVPVAFSDNDATNGILIIPADASATLSMPAIGFTIAQTTNNSPAKVITSGLLTGVDTSTFSIDDPIFVASGGGLNATRPTGTNIVQEIGRVVKIGSTDGEILVYNTGRSTDLPNLAQNKIWLGNVTAYPTQTTLDTSVVPENGSLYFTDERAQDAVGNNLGTGLSYNDSTGAISNSGVTSITGTTNEIVVDVSTGSVTIGIPDSPVFTTPNVGVATATSINGTTIPSSKTLLISDDIGSTVQGYDADLAAIAALATTGIAKRTGAGTWSIITDNSSNWDTAYGWGNHATAGYLTSYAETDPVFLASEAYGITSASTSAWNTAYGWGNHAIAGYLTSYTETDTLENVTDRGATSSNAIEITNATAASSPTTGALIVTGGVGIGEDLYVNNDVHIGGDIHITGSISGSLTYVNVSDLVVTDPLIYLAESNPNDSVDVGIFAALNHGGPSYEHTGLIRDASDSGIWKLASGLGDPTSNVIDFTSATFDTLLVGSLQVIDASTTRDNLGLTIGGSVQAYSAVLDSVAGGTYTGDDSITTVGTISSGTWEGTKVDTAHGGTGKTSYSSGDLLYGNGSGGLSTLTATTDGYVLTLASGVPTWAAASGGGGLSTTTTSITTNSATVIESFGKATSRTAEAIIQITQGTDYYSSKVLFIHDGTNVKITEYAILESTTGAIPITISAAINGSDVELRATITDAATTNATAKVILTEVEV